MTDAMDLSSCEVEPIHVPGAIQPHGALIAMREPGLGIVVASENAAAMLGADTDLVGHPLDRYLDEKTLRRLHRALKEDPRDANPMDIRLRDGREANGLAHRADGLLILEFEPAGADPVRFRTAYRRLVRRFERLRRAASVDEICEIAAREVQELTGFDRVMVYRFDPHANGQVVAEQRADDTLEPYLGLHYPASDIPPQARQLYIRNTVRLIVDADYRPVPLSPANNPLTGQPLDLSHATLRSVSPVHCQYLLNMGVRSSMSISLLDGEQLWGLVACHHREPFHVPYATRLIAEFVSQVLSARVMELERIDALTMKNAAYGVQSTLIDSMVSACRFQDGLSSDRTTLMDLIDCDGAAVLYRGELTRMGETPDDEEVRELGAAVAALGHDGVVATDRLAEIHPPAAGFAEKAAGAIAVPLSTDGDFLFWFRCEHVRSITWAGDPAKPAQQVAGESRLSPRGSFAAWVMEVRGQCRPWRDWEVDVASDFRTALAASIIHQAAELERLNVRLVEAGQAKDRFLAIASHELRNPLSAILGWIKLVRMGMNEPDLAHALETIERNALVQADLIDDLLDVSRIEAGRLKLDMEPTNLADVVRNAIDTMEPTARERNIRIVLDLDQDRAHVVGDVRRLQQVLWNLLTNAMKFSPDDTRIDVTLAARGSELLLEVADQGAGLSPDILPHIFEPFRQGEGPGQRSGLGLGLSIVRNIVELHGGHIAAHSEGPGKGSLFQIWLPVAALRTGIPERPSSPVESGIDLAGLTVLVAEDQADAARMLASTLSVYGAEVLVASDGAQALETLRGSAHRGPVIDLLISDLDMPEVDGFELVSTMRREPELAHIPAVALTAYTRGGDRARAMTHGFRHHVAKPVEPDELIAVVASLMGRLA